MISPNYVMNARCLNVVDGDTVDLTVSPAFKIELVNYRFRLYGIDTSELNAKDEAVRAKAVQARDHVVQAVLGRTCLVQTVKNTLGADKIDSFGRYLAVLYYWNKDGEQVDLNQELVQMGLAIPYRGQGV